MPTARAPVLLIDCLDSSPVTSAEITRASVKDRTFAQVLNWVWRGWPEGLVGAEFKPFFMKQDELSAQRGCLLWGDQVVVPPNLRTLVLKALHVVHPGIVRMKTLARSYVWWPNMDWEIAEWVATCTPCQESQPAPPDQFPHLYLELVPSL